MLKNNIDSILLIHNKWVLVGAFLLSLLFLPLLTLSLLDHPPEYDELLHVLSARSMNVTGEPDIADGYYDRAKLFTSIVASALRLGDAESADAELIVARLPALLSAMLLVGLICAWVTRKVGWLAGLTAAFVLAIAPSTIHLSVLVRFYTLHALVATSMLILVYESMIPGRTIKFTGPAIGAIALLFFCWHSASCTHIDNGTGWHLCVKLPGILRSSRYHYQSFSQAPLHWCGVSHCHHGCNHCRRARVRHCREAQGSTTGMVRSACS